MKYIHPTGINLPAPVIEVLMIELQNCLCYFPAGKHGTAEVGVFDGLTVTEPVCLLHGAIGFVNRLIAQFHCLCQRNHII